MRSRNSRYTLRLATPADSAAIGRVLESGSFPGSIAVRFTRRPDAYQSLRLDGDALVMPAAVERETGEIVAVGGCVVRSAYVNGKAATTGYLTGMKILEEHRMGRIPITGAYELIRRETGSCGLYVTTILAGNEAAIRLLEKPRKGMPRYHPLGEYTVFCMGAGRRHRPPRGATLARGHDGAVAEFYRRHLPEYQLAPVSEWLHGLTSGDFYSLRDDTGRVLAAGALWNQRDRKQYTVTGYHPLYGLLRRLPTRALGYPVLPEPGKSARYLSIALPVVDPAHRELGGALIRQLTARAEGCDFVMLGLLRGHPLFDQAERLPHIPYRSKVYTVAINDGLTIGGHSPAALDGRPILLEVGLL